MTTDGPAIEVRGLHKAYGGRPAVRGIDLSVARGEVFALLGPNGAGKTTTVEILEGYRSRDSGEVRVLGLDPARGDHDLKTHIGIVLQSTGIDVYLTAAETVDLLGAAYPHRLGTDTALELVGLRSERDHLVRKLSGGQRRRLDVAVALVGDADLLFLDEPTTGFDPSARRTAWDLVKDLAGGARPSSSPPTTWKKPSTWPTASPLSPTVVSWPRARPGSWGPGARRR